MFYTLAGITFAQDNSRRKILKIFLAGSVLYVALHYYMYTSNSEYMNNAMMQRIKQIIYYLMAMDFIVAYYLYGRTNDVVTESVAKSDGVQQKKGGDKDSGDDDDNDNDNDDDNVDRKHNKYSPEQMQMIAMQRQQMMAAQAQAQALAQAVQAQQQAAQVQQQAAQPQPQVPPVVSVSIPIAPQIVPDSPEPAQQSQKNIFKKPETPPQPQPQSQQSASSSKPTKRPNTKSRRNDCETDLPVYRK